MELLPFLPACRQANISQGIVLHHDACDVITFGIGKPAIKSLVVWACACHAYEMTIKSIEIQLGSDQIVGGYPDMPKVKFNPSKHFDVKS